MNCIHIIHVTFYYSRGRLHKAKAGIGSDFFKLCENDQKAVSLLVRNTDLDPRMNSKKFNLIMMVEKYPSPANFTEVEKIVIC